MACLLFIVTTLSNQTPSFLPWRVYHPHWRKYLSWCFFACLTYGLIGADIFSPFVGDAERVVRVAFTQARAALPAVLFFDELEAIVGKRGSQSSDSSSSVTDRVMATFLNEMDGIEACQGLLVLGATNRPDMIDAGRNTINAGVVRLRDYLFCLQLMLCLFY